MALVAADLKPSQGSSLGMDNSDNGGKVWAYTSLTDNLVAIAGAGYFDDVDTPLRPRDLIVAGATDGGVVHHVTAVSGAGVVTFV